jgi:hypothetical protein
MVFNPVREFEVADNFQAVYRSTPTPQMGQYLQPTSCFLDMYEVEIYSISEFGIPFVFNGPEHLWASRLQIEAGENLFLLISTRTVKDRGKPPRICSSANYSFKHLL